MSVFDLNFNLQSTFTRSQLHLHRNGQFSTQWELSATKLAMPSHIWYRFNILYTDYVTIGHHPEQPDPHQHQGDRSHSPHAICHQGIGATRGTETTEEVVWQWWKEGERREWEGRPHRLPRRNPFFKPTTRGWSELFVKKWKFTFYFPPFKLF